MQQYPTYSMNSNPMMYQPMQNPYMDNRLANLQQFQQQLNVGNSYQGINGKVVESIDIVRATDIPMDGNMYYFPKADGTEIYTKQWLSNGQTRILTFKPFLENNPNNLSSEEEKLNYGTNNAVLEGIYDKVEALSNKIDEMIKQKTTPRAKKEVVNDE